MTQRLFGVLDELYSSKEEHTGGGKNNSLLVLSDHFRPRQYFVEHGAVMPQGSDSISGNRVPPGTKKCTTVWNFRALAIPVGLFDLLLFERMTGSIERQMCAKKLSERGSELSDRLTELS